MSVATDLNLDRYCTDVRLAREARVDALGRSTPTAIKDEWLRRSAALLREHDERIIEANAHDLAAAPGLRPDRCGDRSAATHAASGSKRSPRRWSRSPNSPTRSAK